MGPRAVLNHAINCILFGLLYSASLESINYLKALSAWQSLEYINVQTADEWRKDTCQKLGAERGNVIPKLTLLLFEWQLVASYGLVIDIIRPGPIDIIMSGYRYLKLITKQWKQDLAWWYANTAVQLVRRLYKHNIQLKSFYIKLGIDITRSSFMTYACTAILD